MDIHVTLPSKKVTTLICSQDDKIEDIKLKVEQKEGIPVEHQALLFEDDKMTLREANITPGLHFQVFYDFSSYAQVDHIRTMDLYLQKECRQVVQSHRRRFDAQKIFDTQKDLNKTERAMRAHSKCKAEKMAEEEAHLIKVSALQREVDEFKREQENEKKSFNAEIHNLRTHSTEQERQNENLHERLTASQVESGRLQRQNQILQDTLAASEGQLAASQSESAKLQERLAASQSEYAKVQERLAASQYESAELEERLVAALGELQRHSQRDPEAVDITPWNVPRSDVH
ncbi:hypothetical protein GBAR_LOCUS24920, partial [Geodia barretti]